MMMLRMSGAARPSRFRCLAIATVAGLLSIHGLRAADSCEQLSSKLKLPQARVTSAEVTPAGSFLPPNVQAGTPEANPYKNLPAFCRVQIKAQPSRDSEIAIEVWLPVRDWNSRLRGQGNGGYAGQIDYSGMAGSIRSGYATAATDAGHKGEGTDSDWALGHPEKIVDFGYRAVHEMTADAKAAIAAYYSRAPKRAYFDSCSDGGREALMEAQRFPQDYDGILAGAPANFWTHLVTAGLQVEKTLSKDSAHFIPPEKLPAITNAALHACGSTAEVQQGFLNDPSNCHFDPNALLCHGTESSACLSAQQVDSVRAVYRGGVTADGRSFFPGAIPSGEAGDGGWEDWITGPAMGKSQGVAYSNGFFRNMVYQDPNWDFEKADVDSALHAADRKLAPVLNSTDPDLSPFKTRDGKLILYHGWLDPAISPLNTIAYYRSVVAQMGQRPTEEFVRLYMVPGMRHCLGGPGPFVFGQLGIAVSTESAQNMFSALRDWVEQGTAPSAIVATKLRDDRDRSKGVALTRPLCPYPETAIFKGEAAATEAAAFACTSSKK